MRRCSKADIAYLERCSFLPGEIAPAEAAPVASGRDFEIARKMNRNRRRRNRVVNCDLGEEANRQYNLGMSARDFKCFRIGRVLGVAAVVGTLSLLVAFFVEVLW